MKGATARVAPAGYERPRNLLRIPIIEHFVSLPLAVDITIGKIVAIRTAYRAIP